MVIAIPTLALIVLAFAVPNYLAIRYAVFGGSPVAPVSVPVAGAKRRSGAAAVAALTQRGYLWKALSPFLFAISVILGIALGGIAGSALVTLALLNVVWGFLGWNGYIPGRK